MSDDKGHYMDYFEMQWFSTKVVFGCGLGLLALGFMVKGIDSCSEKHSIPKDIRTEYFHEKAKIDSARNVDYQIVYDNYIAQQAKIEHEWDSSKTVINSIYQPRLDSLKKVYRK